MSINEWRDNENVDCTYNEIFLRSKEYQILEIDKLWGLCAKWNKPATEGHDYMILLLSII